MVQYANLKAGFAMNIHAFVVCVCTGQHMKLLSEMLISTFSSPASLGSSLLLSLIPLIADGSLKAYKTSTQ